MEGFNAKIIESSREFTARERIAIKDTQNAIPLGNLQPENEPIVIHFSAYAIIAVHNEHSEDVDYNNYVLLDNDGNKYFTGSTSFFTAFKEIYDEMNAEGDTDFSISVYAKPSKNRAGKCFLTCSIV